MSVKLSDLMHESDVYEKWPTLFADKELREARKAHSIEWFDLRKGPHYTEAQIITYLQRRIRKPCEQNQALAEENVNKDESSSSKDNGSSRSRTELTLVHGMMPELEERAARALEPGKLKKRKPN
jgi:hypothetical protein